MTQIDLNGYSAQIPGATYLRLGTFDSYGIEQLQIVPGPEWDGLVITATFSTGGVALASPIVVPESGIIDVPPGATAKALTIAAPGVITFCGVTDGVQRISTNIYYTVANHGPVTGTAPDPTPSEWEQFVAQVQQSAQAAAASATQAGESAEQAGASAEQAAASAEAAAQSAEQAQEAGTQAVEDIGTAKENALTAIDDAQSAGVESVEQAGQAQQTAIQQAGEAATQAVQTAQTSAVQAVETAQETAVDAVQAAQTVAEDAIQALVPEVYTKAESDGRYAPIEAAITVSGSGTGLASLSPTVAWKPQGLKLYGRSWQDGTPSVEQEVPIQDAGQSGQIDVTVLNSNILPLENTEQKSSGVTFKISDGIISISGTPNNNVDFNILGDFTGEEIVIFARGGIVFFETELAYVQLIFYTKEHGTLFGTTTINSYLKSESITVTRAFIRIVKNSYTTGGQILFGLNYGSDPKPAVSKSQQLPILTTDGLPGIPVDSGGNWTDETGQQWVSDVVDLAAGTRASQIVNTVIPAGLSWLFSPGSVNRFFANNIPLVQDFINSGTCSPCLCNYFKGLSSAQFGLDGTIICRRITDGSNNRIDIYSNAFASLDEFTAWLKTHAVKIVYLTSSITAPLDAETLAAYRALASYPGTTNILAPDCGIEAAAVGDATQIIADIKTQISDAVSAAVALAQGGTA